jgi:hypothetical protein
MAAYPDGVDATSVSYHNDFGWIYPNQFVGHPWWAILLTSGISMPRTMLD